MSASMPPSPRTSSDAGLSRWRGGWRRWCCPLHMLGGAMSVGRQPDREAAASQADSEPPPSFADITPKERTRFCNADRSATAGLWSRGEAGRPLVLRNARVLTMRDEHRAEVLSGHDVVVRSGRIEAVRPTGSSIPEGAQVLDATGKTLLPGLTDIHAHVLVPHWAGVFAGFLANAGDGTQYMLPYDLTLFNLVAAGVTRIEVMAGCPDSLWMRDSIRAGTLFGPRMTVGSPLIDGPPAIQSPVMSYLCGDLEGGRRAGEQLADMGFDFAKPYSNLPATGYEGLMEVCQRRGVRVMGHVPTAVGVEAALNRGQQGIAHVGELFLNEKNPERSDVKRRDKLVRLMAEHGTWLQATAVVLQRYEAIAGRAPLVNPDRTRMNPLHAKLFADDSPLLGSFGKDPARAHMYDDLYLLTCQYTRAAREAGVRVLTGTDFANPHVVEGWSLHEELQIFVEQCGFTAHEALFASTRRAAQYHGEGPADGTVSAGGHADLLLLDADPLSDITATRRIHAVVCGGRLLDRATLDEGQARVASTHAAMPEPVVQVPEAWAARMKSQD